MIRLNHYASTETEALLYFKIRAKQLLADNVKLLKTSTIETGVKAFWLYQGKKYFSFFIYPQFRGQGIYLSVVKKESLPILTVDDCHIVKYLELNKIPHLVLGKHLNYPEYELISNYYSNQVAKRSKIFLMNHIDEGIAILRKIKASESAIKAFCLHPLLQSDEDLKKNYPLKNIDPNIVLLSMEYRSVANEYLSFREVKSLKEIRLSPLREVNDMLVADKIQNYKDFLLYHNNKHKRSEELNYYFKMWLKKLNISKKYLKLSKIITD